MQLLLADGGSTSTKWAFLDSASPAVRRFATAPLNPTLCADPSRLLRALAPLTVRPEAVRFFGSGCTPQAAPLLSGVLQEYFGLTAGQVTVQSDLVGAAEALWATPGSGRGVACILGTGAIAALVTPLSASGAETLQVAPAPSLGYILGDEGSGSWLGRHFLSDYLKGQMPLSLSADLARRHPELTAAEVIDRVYRGEHPNRYLASMVPLLAEYRAEPYVQELLTEGFTQFFRRNVLPAVASEPAATVLLQNLRCAGSLASVFEEELRAVVARFGGRVERIVAAPLDALIQKYSS
jgi:N-acetylglucosamine kinase-like BadF-type ATPase